MSQNRRIVLASRPQGAPQDSDFRLETVPVPEPGEGQVLTRTIWLSLDPYMRGRMSDAPSYARPVGIGEVMEGGTVSRVVASRAPGFAEGDLVEGRTGWQEYAVADPKILRKLPKDGPPLSTALGVLGMPGMTAWVGLANIGQPKPGETVVVAAASGPVGSMVGQIAKLRGARAVGMAGGREKCAYVRELGFDACIDHRDPAMAERLAEACPKGIDVYFELVGGKVWDAVMPLLNPFARIPVCGLIAYYNMTELPPGPDRTPLLLRTTLTKRLRIQGFIVSEFASQQDEFLREVGAWLAEGKIRHREDVTEGLENAPRAFMGMLRGANFGKTLVRVGPD
ncbi:MAG TPA: NADP-dependent oxidoreductase [Acetobacteraceae bacterium]|nr:NADP-dependent oxidoreductase [Acetobacteraceae bacterium]